MANICRDLGAYGEQWRVAIPPSKKLPIVPNLLVLPPSTEGGNSQSSHCEPKDSKKLRYLLLACDQRSFLTGSRRVDLQTAHIINIVRKDNRRKKIVEDLLTQQCLEHPSFQDFYNLDSIINCFLLEASYHLQWDVYGTFCIVPAVDDVHAMLSALRTSNKQWVVTKFCEHIRPLDVSLAPFDRPNWDIVVLHPQGLLPDGETLPIAQGRYFQTETSGPPQNAPVTWTYWIASGDQLVSSSDPNEFFPPFTAQDARSIVNDPPLPPISSLAMVINANTKLQSFMRDHRASATPRITMFANLISELMDEIFFIPQGYHSRLNDSLSLRFPSQVQPVVGATSIEAASGTGNHTTSGHGFAQPLASVGSMEVPDAPEQPDEDDGLTASEFQLLVQQAHDPELSPRDRSNAASMLICGVHGFAKPHTFESLEDV